jgi:hypothetical protein
MQDPPLCNSTCPVMEVVNLGQAVSGALTVAALLRSKLNSRCLKNICTQPSTTTKSRLARHGSTLEYSCRLSLGSPMA